jgi:hypothetical protein
MKLPFLHNCYCRSLGSASARSNGYADLRSFLLLVLLRLAILQVYETTTSCRILVLFGP